MSNITSAEVAAALWSGALFLEYLPIISLHTRRCVGAEALVRWRCGDRVIGPQEFIPVVENTPVSGLVTYWVIDTVAKELAPWLRAHDDVHIAINVPPEVFGRGGLTYTAAKARVLDLASKFVIEITERGVPDKLGVDELNSRPRNGVLVALDDVGANRAAVLVAAQVRLDILKIERATIEQITRSELSPRETSELSALIRSIELAIVAEGVERSIQCERLREYGIEWAQGWLFSRPLSAADFIEYFSRQA
jgi:sensor c-di-GMP phosphodiesterase-like protein